MTGDGSGLLDVGSGHHRYLVRKVDLKLFFADEQPPIAERDALIGTWYRLNVVRIATAAGALVATYRAKQASQGLYLAPVTGNPTGVMTPVGATKAYVQSLAEGLHHELVPQGVDVLSVAPGPVQSGFGARAGMTTKFPTTPDVVARKEVAALGRRVTDVPGFRAKFLTAALSTLPRRLRVRVLSAVVRTWQMATPAQPAH